MNNTNAISREEKCLVHDSEVIVPGTVLRVHFLQMLRANASIVRGEVIDVFCV